MKKTTTKKEKEIKSDVCESCKGTGRHLPEQTCPECEGTGIKK
jgi:DnaJ-class molecular chaperone